MLEAESGEVAEWFKAPFYAKASSGRRIIVESFSEGSEARAMPTLWHEPFKVRARFELQRVIDENRLSLPKVVGEVAEWFKAPLSKSGSPERRRGFESHPLRHAPRRVHGRAAIEIFNGMRTFPRERDWVRRPEGEAEGAKPCSVPRFAGYRAKRMSTSHPLRQKICQANFW